MQGMARFNWNRILDIYVIFNNFAQLIPMSTHMYKSKHDILKL